MPRRITLLATTFSLLALMAISGAAPARAQAAPLPELDLSWPVRCMLNLNCYIIGYPDLKAGSDALNPTDYQCGSRTDPGLKGIQVIFADRKTTLAGQDVLAAADGRVSFVRAHMPDDQTPDDTSLDCGNEVQIRHLNGYVTRYCHLMHNSITVDAGQEVAAGTPIGKIGDSGDTQTPMLFFEVVHNGVPVDPFSGRLLNAPNQCFSTADRSLWLDDLTYPPAAVLGASFTDRVPPADKVEYDSTPLTRLPDDVSKLVAWVRVMGIEQGDEENIDIIDPTGTIRDHMHQLHAFNADTWIAVDQLALPADRKTWLHGTWTGHYTLSRNDKKIVDQVFTVHVE